MKKILFCVVCACSILLGCKSDPGKQSFANAAEYDEFIQNKVSQMQQTLFAVQSVIDADSSGSSDLSKFSNQIDSIASGIRSLPEFNGNTAYRDAAAKLADFYKESVSSSYASLAKVYQEVKDTALADRQADEIIAKLQVAETAADDNFVKERTAFATQNKISIAEDKEE